MTEAQRYTTEKFSDEPIILATLHDGYDMLRDLPESSAAAIALLDTLPTPVYYIVDLSALDLDVDGVINGANGASGGEGSLYRHPMIREVLFVSTQEIVSFVAEGLNSDPFGHVHARAFATLDEALAYARGG